MAKKVIPVNGDGDSGALNSYLRQLGAIEVPDAETLQLLCRDFENSALALRRAVVRFGFTAREMLRMIERGNAGESELTELFLPSGFEGKKVPHPAFFIPWQQKITAN